MLQRLLGHEARMHAAHNHGHAPRAECVRDLVAAVDISRHRGNPHQIRLQVEIDGLDVLVGQHDLVLIAGNAGGDGEQARKRRV